MITTYLPLHTVSGMNTREHWSKRKRRAAEHRGLACLVLKPKLRAAPHPLPVQVTVTRIAPRALDGDNLQAALKHVRDGVADALGVDDHTALVEWVYRQQRGAPREYGVAVTIEPAPGSEASLRAASKVLP